MNAPHPGGVIRRQFLDPLEISITDLANAMQVSVSTVSRVVNEKAELSSEMACRISYVLGGEAEMWMGIQADHSLEKAKQGFNPDGLKKLWNPPSLDLVANKGCREKTENKAR